MNEEEVFKQVIDSIRLIFGDYDVVITKKTVADEVNGWDSLYHSLFILDLEKKFGITIPLEVTCSLKNVGELVEYMMRRIHENSRS
ncbi:MAG: hypothetical protein A2X46_15915 [Lentisphaerae bacterium GWF2_57_35]|nr:MAG: hypothetical protein A2X46_15915 [Lentisphaerae bacterium GWF2_57_35]